MSEIPSTLEQELMSLEPKAIENDFFERLVACAEGSDLLLSSEEIDLEDHISFVSPSKLPAAFEETLLEKIGDAPFHVDEKIVLFNKSNQNSVKKSRSNILRFPIAAAAAVALLGSIAAFMVPGGDSGKNQFVSDAGVDTAEVPVTSAVPAQASAAFSPVSFNRDLSQTSDQGVVWPSKTQPQRVMRMIYTDRATLSNAKGETIEVALPKVEYVMIPEKID